MKNIKDKNGITLVALVITIILLLILAGITIAQLTGSGIFENARLAEEEYKNAQEKEESLLSQYENEIDGYIDSSRNKKTTGNIYKLGTYNSTSVSAGANIFQRLEEANTIEINVAEKYDGYENLTKNDFLIVDTNVFSGSDTVSNMTLYGSVATEIIEYDNIEGVLKIVKTHAYRDCGNDELDICYNCSCDIYILENLDIIEL